MSGASPVSPQNSSLTRPDSTGAARHTDWVPILLRFQDGPLVAAAWGSGDPDTIPDEFFELPQEVADQDGEEILEPSAKAKNDAGMPAPIASPVPRRGEVVPFRPAVQSRFRPLTLEEIADLPPPAWLIDGLVPEDGLVVLYGEPAVGKSFVALDWGLSVATGVPWLGCPVRQGEVVYIYAEGVRGLRRRAEAWMEEHQRHEAPYFRAVQVAVSIPDDEERREFVNAVRTVSKSPRLIIVDTLARNFGIGNESLAQDMNAFVRGCDDLRAVFPGATVLVVHHPGKDRKKGARGSLSLQGATDAVFALTRAGDARTLKNEKQKDAEEAERISLVLTPVRLRDGNASCVVRPANAIAAGGATINPHKDPRAVETDAGLLKVLQGFGPGGATLVQWREAADRANDTFYKSRDRLVEDGKVRYQDETARYVAVNPETGRGPEQVQHEFN